jgi:hypothetical protein
MQAPKKRVSIGSVGICHRFEGHLWGDTVEKLKFPPPALSQRLPLY